MALLKKLWNGLGLIQTLAVAAEPWLFRRHRRWGWSVLWPGAGLRRSRVAAAAALTGSHRGRCETRDRHRWPASAGSGVWAVSQLAGFLWEVTGRQKCKTVRPVAWERWCRSIAWVGEGPCWAMGDGQRWRVWWLLLSRLLGNRCETHSAVGSSLTICSETSRWKESKTVQAHPARQLENLLAVAARRPGALSSLALALDSCAVKLRGSKRREVGRRNDKLGFGSDRTP